MKRLKNSISCGRLLQDEADDVFQHVLGQVHVVAQVGEGDLRLDHPELGSVALGVGIFGAEGRAEGINRVEGQAKAFDVQLAADGQVGLLAEEILAEIDHFLFIPGRVFQVQGGDAEHLPGAFAVAAGDDRRVHVDEVAFLEKTVDGVGQQAAHPEDGHEGIGARPQVGDGAQELEGVALFLQRVIQAGQADHFDRVGFQFEGLPGRRRRHQLARDFQSRTEREFIDFAEIGQVVAIDDLQVLETGAVVQFDESEILRFALGADPAAHFQFPFQQRCVIGKNFLDGRPAHGLTSIKTNCSAKFPSGQITFPFICDAPY